MRLARFEMNDVENLITNTVKNMKQRGTHYTLGQLLRGIGFKDNIPLNEDGLSVEDFEKQGLDGIWWPSDKHTIHEAPPCFELVGDSGVYLMPNCNIPKESNFIKEGLVIYAEGCNPDKDDDYYENKEYIFGGDDGSIFVPVEWVLDATYDETSHVVFKLTDDDVSVMRANKK